MSTACFDRHKCQVRVTYGLLRGTFKAYPKTAQWLIWIRNFDSGESQLQETGFKLKQRLHIAAMAEQNLERIQYALIHCGPLIRGE